MQLQQLPLPIIRFQCPETFSLDNQISKTIKINLDQKIQIFNNNTRL
jgi:hypothetical protein